METHEVLKVIEEALKEKVNEINNGGAPKILELVKINIVKDEDISTIKQFTDAQENLNALK